MKTLSISTVLMGTMLLLASCSNDLTGIDSTNLEKSSTLSTDDGICTDSLFTTTIDDLSDADIDGLLFISEEEKLAHDVYTYFYDKYELSIFERIANSEAKHMDAVLNLINHFGLTNPASDEAGVFNNDALQTLYNQLIEQGNATVEDALAVGALIEETDILDLEKLLNNTENSDISMVFNHLLNGSFQHLKGFTRTLQTYEVVYSPQLLSQEAYDAILLSSNGNNGQGNGKRNGHGKGHGKGQRGGNGNGGQGSGGQGYGGNSGNGGNNGQGSGDGTGTCVNG